MNRSIWTRLTECWVNEMFAVSRQCLQVFYYQWHAPCRPPVSSGMHPQLKVVPVLEVWPRDVAHSGMYCEMYCGMSELTWSSVTFLYSRSMKHVSAVRGDSKQEARQTRGVTSQSRDHACMTSCRKKTEVHVMEHWQIPSHLAIWSCR